MCAGLPVRLEREGLAGGPEVALRAAGAAKGLVASAEDQAVAGIGQNGSLLGKGNQAPGPLLTPRARAAQITLHA